MRDEKQVDVGGAEVWRRGRVLALGQDLRHEPTEDDDLQIVIVKAVQQARQRLFRKPASLGRALQFLLDQRSASCLDPLRISASSSS